MKKTVDEVIRNRRSARKFTDYIIPDQELMEIPVSYTHLDVYKRQHKCRQGSAA